MRTTLVARAALAGGLLLSPLMLGPTQAGSAPDLKNAVRAIHESAIINGDWDHNHRPIGTITTWPIWTATAVTAAAGCGAKRSLLVAAL